MDQIFHRDAYIDAIYLVGCAVKGSVPDGKRIENMDLDQVYDAARKHLLTAATGMALESAGYRDERFARAIAMAQRKIALLDADRAAVLAKLEEAGIWYMPLKGSVIKSLYPRFGMREMGDNDILFDKGRAEDVREIMEGLGFTTEDFGYSHHDIYHKLPVSNFEMHRTLVNEEEPGKLYPYYTDVKNRLIRDEGKQFGFHFSDEDFYIYLIVHEYKHFRGGGTGLRSLLDTYVYLNRKTLDMDYVAGEVEKLGIAEFEKKNRALAFHLFNGDVLTTEEEAMLDYIITSGVYGTIERVTLNVPGNQVADKGRWKYFLSRLTMSRKGMERLFPVLKKAPFLYPLFWILRLLRGFFLRNKQFRIQLMFALGLKKPKDQ